MSDFDEKVINELSPKYPKHKVIKELEEYRYIKYLLNDNFKLRFNLF